MTHKTFWNRLKEPRAISQEELRIERALMPRMQLMGYILLGFSICSLCFALFSDLLDDPATDNSSSTSSLERAIPPAFFLEDSPDELEPVATEILNFYVISCILASLSVFCFVFTYKKKKQLTLLQNTKK